MPKSTEDQTIEGFICPECFSVFDSDDQLLSHIFHRHPSEPNKQLPKSFAFYDCERSGPQAFEQSVVPWIDTKVSLCPYCGKSFGLGKEPDFSDEEPTNPSQGQFNSHLLDTAVRGSKAVSRLAYAILDYTPVYRRRHHCRLCGHVLCADCSFFLPNELGQSILSALGPQEYELSFVHKSIPVRTNIGQQTRFTKATFLPGDLNISATEKVTNPADYSLRICGVCKAVLERKIDRLSAQFADVPVVQFYKELEELKGKVTYLLRDYLAAIQGLDPVMNKYTAEEVKCWHSDILTAFQLLEKLGHRIKNWQASSSQITDDSDQINHTVLRLAHALSCATRNFIQQTLPTFQQYSLLMSRTKGTILSTRWKEDEVALAELSKRMTTAPDN